ncbi:MAG: response regulator [Methanobacteriota archaeon]|nr:MAG: response regulator [Euryarchaeota archaeon]
MSTIMVVDDEADTRYVVRQLLEKEGYTVVEAADGETCLQLLKEKKPDLVLLDIMMPGLDGWGVLGMMQSDPELRSIPVSMFTVKPLTPETIRKKEVEGLVNYIVKPFSKDGLVKSVGQTLEALSQAEEEKAGLELLDRSVADEYEALTRQIILHQNFLSLFKEVLRQRKEDGSMDDIQSFEDVIKSESMLIEGYMARKREIEKLIEERDGKRR